MSPTRLAGAMSKGAMARLIEERAVVAVRAAPPWSGLLQDSTTNLFSAGITLGNSELYGAAASSITYDLIARGETLTWDYGWKRMQGPTGAAALPLGGHTTPFPLTTTSAACNEIGVLVYVPSVANTTAAGASVESNVAITVDGTRGNGRLFYLNIAAGDWAVAAPTGGAAAVLTDETRRIDWAIYPLAVNPVATTARQATLIWCNGVGTNGRVWYWPADRDGTTFERFPETAGASYPQRTDFQAESVCVADERVLFLGTSENGVSYPQRVCWTAGSWTNLASATGVWNNHIDGGAGSMDLVEFQGKGLRILPQGQRVVAYFDDGVAVLQPTGRTTPTFVREYVTKQRGLLGKDSVVDLGAGNHFGIFTDGFWFFTEQGEWREAGVTQMEGSRIRKWTDLFFNQLDRTQANRITMGYDRERQLIYIGFPKSNSGSVTDQCWVYEIGADRMWPQRYQVGGGLGGASQYPFAWGWLRSTEGPTSVKMALTHGSQNGFVWEHVPDLYTRDAASVGWYYQSSAYDYSDPYALKTLLTDRIDYHSHGVAGTFTSYKLIDGRDASTVLFERLANVTYTSTIGDRNTLMIPVHATGLSVIHQITATHPFTIFGMQHEVVKAGDAL